MDDVIIIGGSFAGLAGALQLGRARRKVTVLDTGLPRNRFAGHSHGLLGHDHKPPLDILAEARQQLARYPTVRLVNARAEATWRDNFDCSDRDHAVAAQACSLVLPGADEPRQVQQITT